MSFFPSCSAAAALILAASLSPDPLVGQQDSTMMSHDSMMAMPADTGMGMSHDSMMMDHGTMMKHEDGMTFVGADGQSGYFQQSYFVYDRTGQPCRVCGAAVRQIRQGQRSTFYCVNCQK